jgi:hypothetical protein
MQYALSHWRSFIVLTFLGALLALLLSLKNGFDTDYVLFGLTVGWGWWAWRLARASWI